MATWFFSCAATWCVVSALVAMSTSGCFNPVPPNASTGVPDLIGAPTPYHTEEVDSYEVGTKYMSADRSVRLNVAIFHAEYEQLRLNGSWSYHSHYFNNVANEGPLVQTPAAGIYNASIGWTDPSEHWKVALEGRNLADKHYVLMALQSAHATQPAVTAYPNAPRQIMMRASYSF